MLFFTVHLCVESFGCFRCEDGANHAHKAHAQRVTVHVVPARSSWSFAFRPNRRWPTINRLKFERPNASHGEVNLSRTRKKTRRPQSYSWRRQADVRCVIVFFSRRKLVMSKVRVSLCARLACVLLVA